MNALSSNETNRFWDAILARDASADGSFVFAVKTTGVYCKPSCAARRPLRKNVEIFADPAAAELRGYRACKRCKPREETWVARACAHLAANVDRRVPLAELAERVGLSPFHVQRAFKAALGVSPRAYAASLRASSLKKELARAPNVTRAIVDAGFESPSRIPDLGMTPSAFRAGGEGLEVRYAIAQSPLGPMLVAVTHRGICAIHLGEKGLEKALKDELPRAKLVRDDRGLGETVAAVLTFFEGSSPSLPLHVRVTAFQRRVYEALRKIPLGTTITYTELAVAIGAPSSVRAVARACATNPIALVIPCHRVVRTDGRVGEYGAGGPAAKRAVLAVEG
ncbi:MAG: bifunctional transcriptional activator/DNA repair enzyme AdaA, partial [Polyangiales bacterium]